MNRLKIALLLLAGLISFETLFSEEITSAERIHHIPVAELAENHTVTLQGVVTYYSPEWPIAFLQDSSAGIYVRSRSDFPIRAGDWVEMKGELKEDRLVKNVQFRVLHHDAPFPEPLVAYYEPLSRGEMDSQWVKIYGRLFSIGEEIGHFVLSFLEPGGNSFRVLIRRQGLNPSLLTSFLGKHFDVHGVVGARVDESGKFIGFQIWTPGLRQLQEHLPAEGELIEMIHSKIGEIQSLDKTFGPRKEDSFILVRGWGTYQLDTLDFFMEDETGGIKIELAEKVLNIKGRYLEVAGVYAHNKQGVALQQASVRFLNEEDALIPSKLHPKRMSVSDIIQQGPWNEWVRCKGILKQQANFGGNTLWLMQSGERQFQVQFEPSLLGVIPSFKVGSELEISGICQANSNDNGFMPAFDLIYEGEEAIHLVKGPPWFTVERLLVLSLLLLVLGTSGYGLAFFFKKQVRFQTRQIEQQMQFLDKLNSQFQAILNAATRVAIFATDTKGVLTLFNPGAERLLGYRASDLVGKHFLSVFHDPKEIQNDHLDSSGVVHQLIAKARELGAEEREWTFLTKNGDRLTVHWMVTAIYSEKQEITGFLVVAQDITERLLNERELIRAKEMADSANQAKTDYLTFMSHEIRTPLNGMIGLSSLLMGTDLNDDQRDYCHHIQMSSRNLLGLINEILDISQIESGKLLPNPEKFSLNAMLEEVVDIVSVRAAGKGLNLVLDYSVELQDVWVGDSMRIKQVLINLMNNAIKFTQSGGIALSVQGIQELEPDKPAGLCFQVEDTGPGIPAERLDEIFKAYHRLLSHRKTGEEGTGLGLAICKRLVELLGGDISVWSQEGVGTRFRFWIPLESGSQPLIPPQLTSPERRIGDRDHLQKQPWVLVLARRQFHDRIFPSLLNALGFQSCLVRDWEEAIRALHEDRAWAGVIVDCSIDLFPASSSLDLFEAAVKNQGEIKKLFIVSIGQAQTEFSQRDGWVKITIPLKPARFVELMMRKNPVSFTPQNFIDQDPTPENPPCSLSPFSDLKVLIVDDNQVNLKVSHLMLKKLGVDSHQVSSGREALSLMGQRRFDVLFLDLHMPEMSGWEVNEVIRNQALPGEKPWVIAFTANALRDSTAANAFHLFDDILTKPVVLESFQNALNRFRQQRENS